MKILVTGATGTVGGAVARGLAGTKHDVVALVRNPDAYDPPEGVAVVQGDLTDAADVRRALAGIDRAFLNMADDDGAVFAAAAGELGLDHVVLLSSFTVDTVLPYGEDNLITAHHRNGEQALAAAGVPATFLRAAGFDYNFLMWASAAGAEGVVRAPWLDVKLPVVDPDDIAAAAVAVLSEAEPAGGAYSITGPAALSVADQTQIASEVLGRELRAERLDLETAKATAFQGAPPVFIESVFGTFGPEAAVLPVSGDVEALTGTLARTFAQWVDRNRAAFG